MKNPQSRSFDPELLVRRLERALLWLDAVAGGALAFGALALGLWWWQTRGGYTRLHGFYLHTAWLAGAALLLAAFAIHRQWRSRWVLQLLPMVVPVLAAQWFLARFIAPFTR